MSFMPNAHSQDAKNAIKNVASTYGIEVIGFLKLDRTAIIPADEMDLLKGVKWENSEVDVSHVQNPLDIMPTAKTMIILG